MAGPRLRLEIKIKGRMVSTTGKLDDFFDQDWPKEVKRLVRTEIANLAKAIDSNLFAWLSKKFPVELIISSSNGQYKVIFRR